MSLIDEVKLYISRKDKVLLNVSVSEDLNNLPFHDLDDVGGGGGVSYLGQSNEKSWVISIITETGKDIEKRYANISNNPTMTTYTLAWANRLILTYNLIEDI